MKAKAADLEAVKALPLGKGTIADAVVDRSGITGEKDGTRWIFFRRRSYRCAYIHPGNKLATLLL
jgi:elongation factor Ts